MAVGKKEKGDLHLRLPLPIQEWVEARAARAGHHPATELKMLICRVWEADVALKKGEKA